MLLHFALRSVVVVHDLICLVLYECLFDMMTDFILIQLTLVENSLFRP
jgi:hypothetical protein